MKQSGTLDKTVLIFYYYLVREFNSNEWAEGLSLRIIFFTDDTLIRCIFFIWKEKIIIRTIVHTLVFDLCSKFDHTIMFWLIFSVRHEFSTPTDFDAPVKLPTKSIIKTKCHFLLMSALVNGASFYSITFVKFDFEQLIVCYTMI